MNQPHEKSSVSDWLEKTKEGSESAIVKLWQRYHNDLVQRAQMQLTKNPAVDGEDIVQSVFTNVIRKVAAGEYGELKDRDGLWRLLLKATKNRIINERRKSLAGKRPPESKRLDLADSTSEDFEELMAAKPSLETFETLVTSVAELLEGLTDDLKKVAHRRLQGYKVNEIAKETNRSVATVERQLILLRKHLKRKIDPDSL